MTGNMTPERMAALVSKLRRMAAAHEHMTTDDYQPGDAALVLSGEGLRPQLYRAYAAALEVLERVTCEAVVASGYRAATCNFAKSPNPCRVCKARAPAVLLADALDVKEEG
mgnify:CR=1 FL=1